jgi:hypothetical protein
MGDLVASRREHFLFGALALLIDNAVYRGANKLSIFSAQFGSSQPASPTAGGTAVRQGKGGQDATTTLCLLDDGRGFSAKDARDVLCAPSTTAPALPSSIHYGNLVCLGAMRTAADCLLFCKGGDGVLSCTVNMVCCLRSAVMLADSVRIVRWTSWLNPRTSLHPFMKPRGHHLSVAFSFSKLAIWCRFAASAVDPPPFCLPC